MTVEEAISIMSGTAEGHLDEFMYDEALKVILSSAEKQIPKKPIPTMEERDDGTKALAFKCPACNEFLFIGDWCWYCGQHIDWSRDE